MITAAEPEKKAVLNVMRPMEGETEIIKAVGENMSYEIGVLGKYSVAHVYCENQGSIKERASILTTQEDMKEVKPIACVMIGIAYGADKEKQKIGDVLISEYVQPYDSIRVSTTADGKQYEEDRNHIKEPGMTIKNQFINYDFGNRKYNIWRGAILSGEKLIDNEEYKNRLIERFSACSGSDKKIIGGEMEGIGLASTLSSAVTLIDISCNRFTYDKQGKLKSIQETKYDFEGKAEYITRVIEENRIRPEECLFVGNSDNDIWAHQSGAKTLVVNPHKITGMNRTEWKYYLEEMVDLHEILPFIFPL